MKSYLILLLLPISLISLSAQNIPIDFEESGNGADWVWTTFENETNPALEIIANPDPSGINTSSTVASFTALQAGQPFAGVESLMGAGIGTFTIEESNSIIRIMVWKSVISDVGIKLVRDDFFSLGEEKVANTVVNQWEQLEFDFSGHIGNTYHQIVVFPDFSDRTMDNVVYFDNVYGGVETTSINELTNERLEVFPNPANDFLQIQSDESIESYKIYAPNGQIVATQQLTSTVSRIDISALNKGLYILEANVNGKILTSRFMKN